MSHDKNENIQNGGPSAWREDEQGLDVDEPQRGEKSWLISLSDCSRAQGRAYLLGRVFEVADWWMYFSRQETVLVYFLVCI